MNDSHYEKTTSDVTVKVEPQYLDDQSTPSESHFVWAYRVVIENKGAESVQLRARYWRITDANGLTQEVQGEGVVGSQPVILPGDSYEYSSGTPLPTPTGFMVGTYTMQKPGGEVITVDIPAFSLDSPYQSAIRH